MAQVREDGELMQTTFNFAISLTEYPQFKRLVQFVEEIEAYADRECFLDLQALVGDCRDDLLKTLDTRSS